MLQFSRRRTMAGHSVQRDDYIKKLIEGQAEGRCRQASVE